MRQAKQPKESLKILNTREKKEVNKKIQQQWGCELDRSFVFLLSNKNKLYVADKDIGSIDTSKLRVDNVGLYVATIDHKGTRLSIEGSQILGPDAKKNVIDIDAQELREWFRGNDLEKQTDTREFVILKHNNDFVGCGKSTEKGILNFVPKTRRILSD
ncbi:hypothetical protein KY349_01465 [Candidatus Woesearchaeota archaeon]|nr:hypothetical protein [Candidatus Woesearchaeota archaeon]